MHPLMSRFRFTRLTEIVVLLIIQVDPPDEDLALPLKVFLALIVRLMLFSHNELVDTHPLSCWYV